MEAEPHTLGKQPSRLASQVTSRLYAWPRLGIIAENQTRTKYRLGSAPGSRCNARILLLARRFWMPLRGQTNAEYTAVALSAIMVKTLLKQLPPVDDRVHLPWDGVWVSRAELPVAARALPLPQEVGITAHGLHRAGVQTTPYMLPVAPVPCDGRPRNSRRQSYANKHISKALGR